MAQTSSLLHGYMATPCNSSIILNFWHLPRTLNSELLLLLPLTHLRAAAWQKATLSPVSADSANSHHTFSRVQNAKGMCLHAPRMGNG